MRTKALLGLAVLAAGALTASAQIYSQNIVGYVNMTCAPGFTMIGNPLSTGGNTVAEVFAPSLPGFSLMTWNGATFDENIYYGGQDNWDDPTSVFAPGKGAFVKNQSTSPIAITFVGEVKTGTQTQTLNPGYNMVSSIVPVAGNLVTSPILNLTNVVANDSILTWNGSTYNENIYYGGTLDNWDSDPTVDVGQGFFYKKSGSSSIIWTEIFNP